MLGTIIIASDQTGEVHDGSRWDSPRGPWATVEVLGKPSISRLAETFGKECDFVSVIADEPNDGPSGGESCGFSIPERATDYCARYRQAGCEAIMIVRCGAYMEIDVAEMFAFHREQGLGATQATAGDGPLDAWMIDSCSVLDTGTFFASDFPFASYRSQGYVNRLRSPQDFRRLVLDSLSCGLFRLEGSEIRPGVWICDGVQIDRSARIVAPAFIGRNVQISDECLITRGSNIERNSRIDFGTAIENSSILPNTYVGIGLDLSHSVVDGRSLFNLRHNVNLEISDPVVLRRNTVHGRERQFADIGSLPWALSSAE
ncbi:MAG TPA: hypothetical protein VMS18_03595 [Candidatus Binatia bacterium]|nr:hypothetical protein [Candidatus Binatia bacterium]